MAMARLCANLRVDRQAQSSLIYERFQAIIVDHDTRPKSRQEALWVGSQLASWGMPFTYEPGWLSTHTSQGFLIRF